MSTINNVVMKSYHVGDDWPLMCLALHDAYLFSFSRDMKETAFHLKQTEKSVLIGIMTCWPSIKTGKTTWGVFYKHMSTHGYDKGNLSNAIKRLVELKILVMNKKGDYKINDYLSEQVIKLWEDYNRGCASILLQVKYSQQMVKKHEESSESFVTPKQAS